MLLPYIYSKVNFVPVMLCRKSKPFDANRKTIGSAENSAENKFLLPNIELLLLVIQTVKFDFENFFLYNFCICRAQYLDSEVNQVLIL